MSFLRTYNDGDYEITQYTSGGTVRDRLTNKEIADYVNYWSPEGINKTTQEQLDFIEKKLGIKINPK